MQEEYEQMVPRIPMESKEFNKIYSHADSLYQGLCKIQAREENSGVTYALTAIGIFVLLVMLLPTLNLVNINITRIMERSSEIGVRKAFRGIFQNTGLPVYCRKSYSYRIGRIDWNYVISYSYTDY